MSINEFLTAKNVNLLWDVIKEDDTNKMFTVEQFNQLKLFIQKTLNDFFEKERANISSLKDLNKKYIIFVISYAHRHLLTRKTNVIDIGNVEKPQLITFEDIQNDRKNSFEQELQKKQQEFTNAITNKIPETPNFSDKLDVPIPQTDNIMERIIQQRTKEEEIFKNNAPINEEWITPKETSIKKEKYISESPNLIKIETNITTPLKDLDIIDLNPSKKHITWEDQEQGNETINVFSKLKKIDSNEETNILKEDVKNIKEEMKIMHTKIDELDKTMNNLLALLKENRK